MKKLLTALVALALVAALMMSAMADTRMYVKNDSAKVYKKNSKDSEVLNHLPLNGPVDVVETEGKWSHVHYKDKYGTKKSGWMRSKDLSATEVHKHSWTPWRVTRKATCAKEGRKEHTCTICGVTKEKAIEKLDHTWGKWSVTVAATCTKAGEKVRTCKVCEKKETKKTGKAAHTFGDWVVEAAATCTTEGSQSRLCSVCGYKETGAIDPLPHTFGPWTVIKPLARDADGERTNTCAVCGIEVRETIKAEPGFARKDKGEGVRAVQTMLNALGYNAGKADGVYGPKLDSAFEQYARDKGVSFASGWLVPAQLDKLVSDWVAAIPADEWKGEGGADAPVSLTLTVDPVGDEGGARSFNWILTNTGKHNCTLRAVLMGLGEDHDFSADDMVAAMDAEKLKPGTDNSLGGSFNVPDTLGDDEALCFRAIVESDKTGDKWLSNAVVIRPAAEVQE